MQKAKHTDWRVANVPQPNTVRLQASFSHTKSGLPATDTETAGRMRQARRTLVEKRTLDRVVIIITLTLTLTLAEGSINPFC